MTTIGVCPDCGWRSAPTTPGRLAHSLRQHSCDKHRRLEAARARGATKRAGIDRRPKPCLHLQADHQHGTNACYHLDDCRCTPCKAAAAAYVRLRYRQSAYGRWHPHVDAQPVREHVTSLASRGMGLKTVAKRSGVSHGGLWKLMYGKRQPDGTCIPSRLVRPDTAAALLAVHADLDTLADAAYTDATGTHRRIQALMAAGWSLSRLAGHLGMKPTNLPTVLHRERVCARTARAVRALYAELATPPEGNQRERIAASRARNYARARGWQPPAWWDDDWLDDPTFDPATVETGTAVVDDLAVELAVSGHWVHLTHTEVREAVRRLDTLGLTAGQIAARVGVTGRTVVRIRAEQRADIEAGTA